MSINNHICLAGKVVSEPMLGYWCYQTNYYTFALSSLRLSGNADVVWVHIKQDLYFPFICSSAYIGVEGELRTCNREIGGKRRLVIYVHAQHVYPLSLSNDNQVFLKGSLCKQAQRRFTPLGKEIADAQIAVRRASNKCDFIPLIVWGMNASAISNVQKGGTITVMGRLQSRAYTKQLDCGTVEQRTAYEVSVGQMQIL